VFLALVVAVPSASLAYSSFGEEASNPYVTGIDCSAIPNVTHEFFKDGRTHYTIPGQCQVRKSNGQIVTVRYHVDGNWTPGTKSFATETGRIYDLGIVAPELFQPGPPGHYTPFIVRLLCESDPWLNDARCGLEYASGVDELAKLFDRFSRGPFPLTKGAIPASKRAALLTEYKRATGQVVGSLSPYALKRAPGIFATQPKPPPPPPTKPSHGATYKPEALQTLNRGQTKTVRVQVTNTGTLTWTPSGNNRIRLAYHWYKANAVPPGTAPPPPAGGIVVWEGRRTGHSGPLGPNQSTNPPIRATIVAPSSPGTYVLKWDMVQEYVTWFSQKGVATFDQTVVVR
jgi:hypothetical protein